MIYYYYNPNTDELIILDSEKNEVFIIRPLEEMEFEDGKEEEEIPAPRKPKELKKTKEKDQEKPRKPTTKKPKPKGKKLKKLAPEIIDEIKRRIKKESAKEIAADLGICLTVVYKYTNKERKDNPPPSLK